ncbi:MAG: hypothetical protein UY92_C0006G0027 [Candidatus Magasanikbacteria bacterium GW2011_GWA2_56_11]|uniref:Uncharacterized protein n=1 Tax=Candidatus Magasanikbacteria bacterium GW2011_GWA2_56_11 TaxID=1619044 RepID=A0A0G1YGU5_9BACT|nr:MAG: hypothetical protein UY92_C0006G0027 [Candidatus Magasanikbacteria bacterium GW2011_GWA2_56_11]
MRKITEIRPGEPPWVRPGQDQEWCGLDQMLLEFPIHRGNEYGRTPDLDIWWNPQPVCVYTALQLMFAVGFLPEDLVQLGRYRRRGRRRRRRRPTVALFSSLNIGTEFWIVPYLDPSGAWCSLEVHYLLPCFGPEWDFLVSRLP